MGGFQHRLVHGVRSFWVICQVNIVLTTPIYGNQKRTRHFFSPYSWGFDKWSDFITNKSLQKFQLVAIFHQKFRNKFDFRIQFVLGTEN